MPRDDTRQKITEYVQARLIRETEGKRGEAAKIAKVTDFSSAHLSNVMNGKIRGVGDDFARAIARYWGMTFAELEAAATGVPGHIVEFDDEDLDPKEEVRRSYLYREASPAARHAWETDDRFTHAADAAKLTSRVYYRTLLARMDDADAGLLPDPNELLEGAEVQPDVPDPDAPPPKPRRSRKA